MTATTQMFAEGVQFILNQLKTSTIPTNYYLLLVNFDGASGRASDAAPSQTLAGAIATAEPTGTSTAYARQAVAASALTISSSGSYYQLVLPAKTFGAFTGAGLPINATHAILATTIDASGHAIAAVPLNAARIYNTGDTEVVTFQLFGELGA